MSIYYLAFSVQAGLKIFIVRSEDLTILSNNNNKIVAS